MLPVNPASTSRSSSWLPIELRRRLAPMTAIVRGGQDGAHAQGLGAVLARHRHGLGGVGRLDVEAHLDHAVLDVPLDVVAGVGEDGEHLAVLRQHLGGEPRDAELLGDGGEVLEQHRADALALVVVADVERHLGAARVDAVVAPDADDLLAHRGDEGDPVGVVDVGEPEHVGVAQLAQRREEAQVDRLVGLRGVEAPDAVAVGRADRPHVGDRAVAQDDVGLPLHGVAGWERLVLHGPIVPPRGCGRAGPRWADGPGSPRTPRRAHWALVELRDAVLHRRMVRRFDPGRAGAAPRSSRDLVALAVRAPSAGFSQGWDFVALLDPADRADVLGGRRRRHPARRLARGVSRGAGPGALPQRPGRLPRPLRRSPTRAGPTASTDRWPVPYWDTDVAMAAMLMLLAAAGCRSRRAVLRGARRSSTTPCTRRYGIPDDRRIVGVVALGREAERVSGSPRTRRRRPLDDVLHVGRFGATECREVMAATAVREDGADPRRGTAAHPDRPGAEPHPHGQAQQHPSSPRGLRRADRRHRRRGGDAQRLPRVLLQRHLLAGPARRPRRPEAGAAPHPLRDERARACAPTART